jgi:hypothetical protein
MSRKERITLHYTMAGAVWMLLSHRYRSLRFRRLFPLVRDAFSTYEETLAVLEKLPHCLSFQELKKRGLFKERHWRSGAFMAAATSLPLLYKKVAHQDILKAICAKTSIVVSAKLLDNLNDELHSYQQALHSLSEYRSALSEGRYTKKESPLALAEQSAYEIAAWAHKIVSPCCTDTFCQDVALLVDGQVASLQHKKVEYPSMREYLSRICERSIGNIWIDVDLKRLGDDTVQIKKGNDFIHKSYLIYDDVQDIARDVQTNSVNAAVILGLERGILSESKITQKNQEVIISILRKNGIFQDLLHVGDLMFLKGLEIISECSSNPIDTQGFSASLGMIRMFNMRRILKKERNVTILRRFLADPRKLKEISTCAPARIQEMVLYV